MRRNSPGTSLETPVRSVFEAHAALDAHALEIEADLDERFAGVGVGGAGGFVGGDVGGGEVVVVLVGFKDASR